MKYVEAPNCLSVIMLRSIQSIYLYNLMLDLFTQGKVCIILCLHVVLHTYSFFFDMPHDHF